MISLSNCADKRPVFDSILGYETWKLINCGENDIQVGTVVRYYRGGVFIKSLPVRTQILRIVEGHLLVVHPEHVHHEELSSTEEGTTWANEEESPLCERFRGVSEEHEYLDIESAANEEAESEDKLRRRQKAN